MRWPFEDSAEVKECLVCVAELLGRSAEQEAERHSQPRVVEALPVQEVDGRCGYPVAALGEGDLATFRPLGCVPDLPNLFILWQRRECVVVWPFALRDVLPVHSGSIEIQGCLISTAAVNRGQSQATRGREA